MDKNRRDLFGLRRRRCEIVICLGLVLLTLAAFWPLCTDSYQFINLDDPTYVTLNRHTQAGLCWSGVRWALTTNLATTWHPLTWLSLQLDYQLYGLDPRGYHLTNVLLHTASTVLLFLSLRRLTGSRWRSAAVAALFAVHPLHVESVAWVSERKGVLSTLFWMLTLLAYSAYAVRPGLFRYFLIVLALALGLLAKPVLATLPCVLLLLDYWPLGRWRWRKNETLVTSSQTEKAECEGVQGVPVSLRWLVWEKIPLFTLAAASVIITLRAQEGPVRDIPLPARMANAPVVYVTYIRQMIWPSGLALFFPSPGSSARPVWAVAAGLLLAAVSLLVLQQARSRPYLLVGWLWYLGTLVPVIGLVQIGRQVQADRYTYVPLIGLFIALVWGAPDLLAGVARLGRRQWCEKGDRRLEDSEGISFPNWSLGTRSPPVPFFAASAGPVQAAKPWHAFGTVAVVLLAGCLLATWSQLHHWRNSVTLWEHALAVDSDNFMAHYCLGTALEEEGNLAAARAHYQEAVRIHPRFLDARYALALLCLRQGEIEEAKRQAVLTLEDHPDHVPTLNCLGLVLVRQGKMEAAEQQFRAVLAIDPDDLAARVNLAQVFLHSSRVEEAIEQLARVLEIDSNFAEAHHNLGVAYRKQGKLMEAIDQFLEAAEGHARAGRPAQAIEDFLAAADAYARAGRFDEATATAKRAGDLVSALPPRGQADLDRQIRERLNLYERHRL